MSLSTVKALLEEIVSEEGRELTSVPKHVSHAIKSLDSNAKLYRATHKDGSKDMQRVVYHLGSDVHPDKISHALKSAGFKGDSTMHHDRESMTSSGAHHHDTANRLKVFVRKEHGSPTEVHVHTY